MPLYFSPSLILDGLLFAALIFLISAGLNIIYGVLRILNIAHGSFFLLGAYVGYTVFVLLFDTVPIFILLLLVPVLAGLFVGVIGLGIEFLLRPIYKVEEVYQLLLTFGLILVFADSMKLVWGVSPYSASELYLTLGSVEILGTFYPAYNIFVIAIAAVVGIVLWLFISRSRYGVLMRAVASDKEISRVLAINVNRVYNSTFATGAALAALGGAIIMPTTAAVPGLEMDVIVEAFVAVVIGGLGSIKGAFLGALIIGLVRSIGVAVFPEITLAVIYLVMVAVLIVKPAGLFGVRE